jgi:hypothetical protein
LCLAAFIINLDTTIVNVASATHGSFGAAIRIAKQAYNTGHPVLAAQIHQAASTAFFHGFSVGCLAAAAVSAVGAIAAFALLPAKRTHLVAVDLEASLQTVAATEL